MKQYIVYMYERNKLNIDKFTIYTEIDFPSQTWGSDTSTWTSDNINIAGRVLQGLSVPDINSLVLTADQIFSLGTHSDWEDTKVTLPLVTVDTCR